MITPEKREVSPGVFKTFYTVRVEGINKYTGKRKQLKTRGISSLPKARRIEHDLWIKCRDCNFAEREVTSWGNLLDSYFSFCEKNMRKADYSEGFSPATIVTKKSRFVHLGSWLPLHLDLVTPMFIRSELDRLEREGVCGKSLTRCILKEIKCVFSYALESGYIKSNPVAAMKNRKEAKKRKVALTHAEAGILLREAKQRNHPYYFIWLMALATGMRRSELAGLKWSDVDFKNRLIYVQRQNIAKEGIVENLKTKEDRPVPIPQSIMNELTAERMRSTGEFVIDLECKSWRSGEQSRVTREFCLKIGIKEITFHQLRATFITNALADAVPLGIVKEVVGHAKLSTTDVYFRSSGIDLTGKTDKLSIHVPEEKDGEVVPLRVIK